MDSVDFAAAAVNDGLAKRRALVAGSRELDMMGAVTDSNRNGSERRSD